MRNVLAASGEQVASRWFSAAEAAAYLRFPSVHAFIQAYPQWGIPAYRAKGGGRRLRFRQEDLDAALVAASAAVAKPARPDGAMEPKLGLALGARGFAGRPRR